MPHLENWKCGIGPPPPFKAFNLPASGLSTYFSYLFINLTPSFLASVPFHFTTISPGGRKLEVPVSKHGFTARNYCLGLKMWIFHVLFGRFSKLFFQMYLEGGPISIHANRKCVSSILISKIKFLVFFQVETHKPQISLILMKSGEIK